MPAIIPHPFPSRMEVVDSHTGGEPTRVILSGWPQPEGADMPARLRFMKQKQDGLRRASICEPRGHDAIVGALLTPPVNPDSAAGVIFFNDVGYLGMCGHASIGVVVTLKFLGRIGAGKVRLDTPVGTVSAELDADGVVTLENVPGHLHRENVEVNVPGVGKVRGDVAWGGNWFFLAESVQIDLHLGNLDQLMAWSKAIRQSLEDAGITGSNGERVDHVEFYGPPTVPGAHSRNFVLCPGNAYDRSPCGTGTSAKMAAMHHKGKLKIGQKWIQESITGSVYEGHLSERSGEIIPVIRSKAHVTGRNALIFDSADPFCWGIGDAA